MTNKLSVHFQKTNNKTAQIVKESSVEWVYIVDPPNHNPFPNKKVVARVYEEDEIRLRGQGVEGAETWWDKHQQDVASIADYVHAVVVCNEPGFNPTELDYQKRWIEICNNRFPPLKTVAFNWGVGNPDQYAARNTKVREIAKLADYFGFHEYWVPEFLNNPSGQYSWIYTWVLTRYKIFMNNLPDELHRPIFITECGAEGDLNRFVQGKKRKHPCGWKELYDGRNDYISHIQKYNTKAESDVKAIFLFTAGPYGDWEGYDITPGIARIILPFGEQPEPTPPSPPPKPVPDDALKRLAACEAAIERVFGMLEKIKKWRKRIESLERTREGIKDAINRDN